MTDINWFWIVLAVGQVGAGVWAVTHGQWLMVGLSACYAAADVILAFVNT